MILSIYLRIFSVRMCILCAGSNLFLPAPTQNQTEKRKRLPHPFEFVLTKKKGNGYSRYLNKRDVPTEHLSGSKFLAEIESYVSRLSRESCCVSVEGEARKCQCLGFLADKPSAVKAVASGLQKYFDLDEPKRKLLLANEQRHANRLTKF